MDNPIPSTKKLNTRRKLQVDEKKGAESVATWRLVYPARMLDALASQTLRPGGTKWLVYPKCLKPRLYSVWGENEVKWSTLNPLTLRPGILCLESIPGNKRSEKRYLSYPNVVNPDLLGTTYPRGTKPFCLLCPPGKTCLPFMRNPAVGSS